MKGLAALLIVLTLAGCGPGGGMVDVMAPAAVPGSSPSANQQRGDGVYRIQSGDILEVTVYQLNDLNRLAEVDGAGNINLALIGAVPAVGRSARELEAEVASRYRARYLQNPQVSIFVRDSVGARVTVDGAVKRPGIIMARGEMTLLRALAEAQGFTDTADQTSVVILRNSPNGRTAARFDANAIRAGQMADPPILGGDTIVVDDSTAKTAWKHFREALPVAGLFRVF
jgi:polysaccharide export outer membrane protein